MVLFVPVLCFLQLKMWTLIYWIFVQLFIWFIVPATEGLQSDIKDNALALVILFQYIPRLYLIFPLSSAIIKATGVVTMTAWAGAAYNMFLYILASHVHSNLITYSFITLFSYKFYPLLLLFHLFKFICFFQIFFFIFTFLLCRLWGQHGICNQLIGIHRAGNKCARRKLALNAFLAISIVKLLTIQSVRYGPIVQACSKPAIQRIQILNSITAYLTLQLQRMLCPQTSSRSISFLYGGAYSN